VSEKQRKVIAVQERSAGNEQVGEMWLDTETFVADTPIEAIVRWADKRGNFMTNGGRLIITVPTSEEVDDYAERHPSEPLPW
jgi:hypothetical protein